MEFHVTFLLPCHSAEVWTPGLPKAEGELPREPETPEELYGWAELEGEQLLLSLSAVASGLESGEGWVRGAVLWATGDQTPTKTL